MEWTREAVEEAWEVYYRERGKENWKPWQEECTNPVITEGECYPVSFGSTGLACCGHHLTWWDLEETQ